MLGPGEGDQACGEIGPGRMLEPEEIAARIAARFRGGALAGVEVLVTAGPTREALDPVRFLTNHSSGKMGYAVAAAAAEAGARVSLVSGPTALPAPPGVDRIEVTSAEEMYAEVMARAARCDIFIAAAAVADYRPARFAEQKIKKSDGPAALDLVRTPDIVAGVAAMDDPPFTVGFAAETQSVHTHARDKLERKGLDMIAANRVGLPDRGFASESNSLSVLWRDGGCRELALAPKAELARSLIGLVAERYRAEHPA
ncbi:MAG: bifunctional phosphopantothenoylcysteine decarboxylase/phosphopantothenate--cysteine ligase CoaBC, partial [Gammaproteobacteria bacterium]|nr:bifunctional phosphopantothenoylcysteine decarboxylase/phosphopantothenate--cysteine ligase CoaBC [Gammaproteobacteria bacterium]